MKKETLLAILIGFGIGLALTFFFYRNRLADFFSPAKILSPLSERKIKLTPTPFPSQTLSVISPIDQSISKEGKTIISGVTSPLSLVLIFGEKGEKVITADNKGGFETDLLLVSGENEITITAIGEKGDEVSKNVTVVYSTVEI